MGQDKAWIPLRGRALVERVVSRLDRICQEVIIVSNDQALFKRLSAVLVRDIFPGKGSLGGIYTGLVTAKHDRAIVVACDMPFLNIALLGYMVDLANEFDVVVPAASSKIGRETPQAATTAQHGAVRRTAKQGNLHPLHAVYSKRCLGPIEARIADGDLRMISFYPDVRVHIIPEQEIDSIDPDHLSLFNVNTPEDLQFAESLAGQEIAEL